MLCAPGRDVDLIRNEGFHVVTLPIERKLTPLHDLVTLAVLVPLLRREGFDLLHSYLPKGGLLGQLSGRVARVPRLVHSCRGLLYVPGMPRWRRQLFRLTDRLTCTLADRVICVSGADRDLLVSEGLCAAEKTVVTGSGIDLGAFDRNRVSTQEVAALRRLLGCGA